MTLFSFFAEQFRTEMEALLVSEKKKRKFFSIFESCLLSVQLFVHCYLSVVG